MPVTISMQVSILENNQKAIITRALCNEAKKNYF
jgi:hypothetical protein